MTSRYADLSRSQLAGLVPELLLCGQLIDRSGMAWCIAAWGRAEMARVAIEEWSGASPVYTRRMQRALGFAPGPDEPGDVPTIFKGLQLDIGAPPQYMDFRYTLHDRWHGEFHLDHCGALMDVEPMGPDYVRSMCHDIEDPTFDATAVATNPRARVRPVQRPPRSAAEMAVDRRPHCAWTVTIDDSHPEAQPSADCLALQGSALARLELDPVDPAEDGRADYAGPVLADLDFAAFSHSALVRLADEVAVQMQLLNLSFVRALRRRGDDGQVRAIATKQLVGIAGVAARRLHRQLGLGHTPADAARLVALHPVLNPAAYVDLSVDPDGAPPRVTLRRSVAHEEDGWLGLVGPGRVRPLQAIVQAVDPHLDVEVSGSEDEWTAEVVARREPAAALDEVAVTDLSTGAGFVFEPRRSLPLTVV
jgi:hypothetical protein